MKEHRLQNYRSTVSVKRHLKEGPIYLEAVGCRSERRPWLRDGPWRGTLIGRSSR